jgi:hypothetical protein
MINRDTVVRYYRELRLFLPLFPAYSYQQYVFSNEEERCEIEGCKVERIQRTVCQGRS